MSKIHSYEGEKLTVHYDVRRCIHAAECVRGAPEVFNPKNRPWILVDAGDADHVAEVVRRCPTGALSYDAKDGGPAAEEAPTENTVRVAKDGPVYLHGDLEIEDAEGDIRRETRVALCRCGASHHKPYCDGSHTKADFTDPGVVGTAKTKDAADRTTLMARVRPDGPVLLDGPHCLVDAEGNTVHESGSGALCRCGRSENRPFCDGSHNQGFEDPGVFGD